ncbi:MAG: aldo/keto reductase [Phenylobacterium sp.]|jgi:aryl-alcohol dehydrogenase-like predicted oxidoreductase|uniref:aldo/keto reductase n=1 Tax=Phenylobacterium sp. TaxID=1871053 RepID=UPI002A35F29C|nr:aldo/keto reductase [Phenylobacterium sp.]MDX9996841.1 aldo/keto reductase [Phenylobacterium sp.]
MEYRRLGNSGLKVSAVGIGCNNFGMRIDQEATNAVVAAALDAGINFFDTADVYGGSQSEVMLGKALAGRRDEVVIATKFASPMGQRPDQKGGSRRYIMQAVEASLKRLGADYIDLYQMHRPDPDTPIEETLAALDDLVKAGKVRYLGNSNFTGWQIADADWISRSTNRERFVSAQNLYSLLERGSAREVLPACERFGLGFLPFFPLASGLLTGKYRKGEPPPEGTRLAAWGKRGQEALSEGNFEKLEKLSAWAEARGKGLLDLAFAWLLGQPVVSSVIAGATRPEQVQANAAAAAWALTPAEVEEVTALVA